MSRKNLAGWKISIKVKKSSKSHVLFIFAQIENGRLDTAAAITYTYHREHMIKRYTVLLTPMPRCLIVRLRTFTNISLARSAEDRAPGLRRNDRSYVRGRRFDPTPVLNRPRRDLSRYSRLRSSISEGWSTWNAWSHCIISTSNSKGYQDWMNKFETI